MPTHPAVLLLVWAVAAFALQWAEAVLALGCAAACAVLSLLYAPRRSRRLLRRSRWLLLSLFVLFVFFTPGEYLDPPLGDLGITREGLVQAGEQIGRLLALLTSLALLHERLGNEGLLAGLYSLLAPFPWREATVVRLMLIIEHVERRPRGSWEEWLSPCDETQPAGDRIALMAWPLRPGERWLIGLMLAALLVLGIWA